MTTVGVTAHTGESRKDCGETSRSVTEEVTDNAHTPTQLRGRQLDLVEVLAIQIWVFCACRKDRGPLACYSQARAMDVMM
jgi:hypothetical protein